MRIKDPFAPKFLTDEETGEVTKIKTAPRTAFQIAQERDQMFCSIFTMILQEFQEALRNRAEMSRKDQVLLLK